MGSRSSFQIFLDAEGDGGEYRYSNRPGEVQRPHIIDRGDCLVVQAELSEVVHGTLTPNGERATILVTDFIFLPSKSSRRFKTASISMRFESLDDTAGDIEVTDIAPRGHFSLHRTTKQVELTRSSNASLQGGTIVTGCAGIGWEKKEKEDRVDHTTLSGTIRLEGRNFGGKNSARWSMSENKAQFSGIPTWLRTVTRLRRVEKQSDAKTRFSAMAEVKCSVDFASSMEESRDRLLGRIPEDDPVIFDPGEKPTTSVFDVENLGSVDLDAHSSVIETTFLPDTIEN
ncbi:MAG: hypothetical protein M1820_007342 [Bogoriella megaspora]|nr:MAG: hypothetical protein M1820_007342 [Bogoriella megaspora]